MSKELLDVLGLDSRRLRLEWISASEGIKFAKTMDDFTKQLVELGPSPLRGERNDRHQGDHRGYQGIRLR